LFYHLDGAKKGEAGRHARSAINWRTGLLRRIDRKRSINDILTELDLPQARIRKQLEWKKRWIIRSSLFMTGVRIK
jgi:hypothetical protein